MDITPEHERHTLNLRERLARIFFRGPKKPKLYVVGGRSQVQEFATREERNERYRVLKERGTPGLCKFTDSVDGPFLPRVYANWTTKYRRPRRGAGHMVWFVAWGS